MSPILPRAIQHTASLPIVVALHCSGGSARQWRALADALDGAATVVAPDLLGSPGAGPWSGGGAFRLRDEAAPILGLLDSGTAPVHLVGHSYGGAVALYAALQRPQRVASLALYEPTAFRILAGMGARGRAALAEITSVARAVDAGLLSGAYARATERFVDYWNGVGTWSGLSPDAQAALQLYLPKACLDFRALFSEPVRLAAYGRLQIPILVVRGERAPPPTALVAERLQAANRHARGAVIRGAGHMGPLTNAAEIGMLLADHVRDAELATASNAA